MQSGRHNNKQTYLVHVRENQKAQLLPHVHCIHGKVVFQLRNWNEPVQLKQTSTQSYTHE